MRWWILAFWSVQVFAGPDSALDGYRKRVESLAQAARDQVGEGTGSMEQWLQQLKSQAAQLSEDLEKSLDFENADAKPAKNLSAADRAKYEKMLQGVQKWIGSVAGSTSKQIEKSTAELRKLAEEAD